MMTEKERRIAAALQKDIPLEARPFKKVGKDSGFGEQDVLSVIQDLMQRRMIRKFGAILRHQKAGFTRNVMVLWAVPEDRCEAVGKLLASYPQITHCYRRKPAFEGKYTLFTMIHLKADEDDTLIGQMAEVAGVDDYKSLVSEEEYKKSSMEYF